MQCSAGQAIEGISKHHIPCDIESKEVEDLAEINGLASSRLQEIDELVCVLHDDRFLLTQVGVGEGVGHVASTGVRVSSRNEFRYGN